MSGLAALLLPGRAGRILDPPCGSRSRRIGLDPKPVVHGVPELLLAAEVAFGRLNRHVAQQELNLVEFAAGQVAEPGARTTEVMWREPVDAGLGRGGPDDVPQHLGRHAGAPDTAAPVDGPEHRACGNAGDRCPGVHRRLDPNG